MARGVHTVTKAIRAAGHPEIELVRGEGYHYFIFDGVEAHNVYETESIMCPYFNDQAHDTWIAQGIDFAKRVRKEYEL